jgi:Tfp pilus assembly protein PilO
MKNLLRHLRVYWLGFGKHLLWMLLSYAGVGTAAWFLVLKPEMMELEQSRQSARVMERNYSLLVSAPELPDSLGAALGQVGTRLDEIYWLNRGPEPNQLLFEYLDGLAVAHNLALMELATGSPDASKAGQVNPYFTWKANLVGTYQDLTRFIHALESDRRYLRVIGIAIKAGSKEKQSTFFLTVAGLRK